ncbi:MAG: alpha/beta fold hydrolase [Anaerolineae bacterium]
MHLMIEGQPVSFSESGAGVPLVLIHGYPLSKAMWEPQLHGLAHTAQVLALDLWGFGDSAPAAETTMAAYADEVRELMDERHISQAVLCGLSMGGYIVFEFCRRYPDRVTGVILANTKAGPDSSEGKAGRDQSALLAREKGVDAIIAGMLPKLLSPKAYQNNPALVEQAREIMRMATVAGIVGALRAMRDRPDSTPTLSAIDCPALVIGGTDDQLFPKSEFDKMAQGLPKGQLVMLPDAGHLSNLEQPDLFNRAVQDFLKDLA